MGQILLIPDGQRQRLIVKLDPAEIIHRPYYIQDIDGSKPYPTGDTIGDAIRRVAWRLAWMHAQPKVEGHKFIELAPHGLKQQTPGPKPVRSWATPLPTSKTI